MKCTQKYLKYGGYAKSILGLLFLSLLFLYPSSICCAATTYQITDQELNQLEQNLNQLEMNNKKLLNLLTASRMELQMQKNQSIELTEELSAAKQESEKLRNQLSIISSETKQLQKSSLIANEKLIAAEKSLNQYERENQSEIKKIKRQRLMWQLLAGLLIINRK